MWCDVGVGGVGVGLAALRLLPAELPELTTKSPF